MQFKMLIPLAFSASLSHATLPDASVQDWQLQQWQMRYWQPAVLLAGDGDPQVAIANLNEMVDLQRVITANSQFDHQTQQFVDDLWLSFESFDLKQFYGTLPDEVDGWRELRVYGARHSDAYQLGADKRILGHDSNVLEAFGDLKVAVKARPLVHKSSGSPLYHLDGDFNVAIGKVSSDGPHNALLDILQVLSTANTRIYTATDHRTKAGEVNPLLGTEDINVVAPLWASYPNTGDIFAKLGQIENLIQKQKVAVGNQTYSQPYQEVSVAVKLEPKKFKSLYPKLAHQIEKLGEVLKFTLDINDEYGRVAQIKLDTHTLRGEINILVNETGVIPVKNGVALVANVRTYSSLRAEPEIHLTTNMDAQVEILGMIYNIEGLGSKIKYRQTPTLANLDINVVGVPKATVEGAALGFVPPSVLNFFLPTNIDEMMHEFFTVACEGNAGEGIVFNAQLEEPPLKVPAASNSSNLRLHLSSETKSGFFVRIAMGVVNQKLIPDEGTSKDIKRLVDDFQQAFRQDLNGFSELVARSNANAVYGLK